MMSDVGIGAIYAKTLVEQELVFVQTVEVNTHTLSVYLASWLQQYSANLVLTKGFMDNRWPSWPGRQGESCMVVGAGPSLSDEQLDALNSYTGFIICSNKVLERMLEHGTHPDLVAVIHSTPEIAAHFKGPLAREALNGIEVVASTMVHPDVTKALLEAGARIRWFNPAIPELFKKNVNEFLYRTSNCPVIDTGGNVGLFMCTIASEHSTFETIGLLGMEQALALDPKWTNEQAMENVIYYAPEDLPEPFAINQVFHGYLQTLMGWYCELGGRKKVYNLTKNGMLYVGRRDGMPYMDLDEFKDFT